MTEIYVAKHSGVLRAPSGEQHRLVAGQTLADGRHEAVTGSPESWMPMTVELSVDGDAPAETDLRDRVAFDLLEADRDRLVDTLTAVVAAFDSRGLLVNVDRDSEGWLVLAVGGVLDELAEPVDPYAATEALEGEPPGVPAAEPEQLGVAAPADPETPEGRDAIRRWAWENGHDVAERGAIPKAVVAAYVAAHG